MTHLGERRSRGVLGRVIARKWRLKLLSSTARQEDKQRTARNTR